MRWWWNREPVEDVDVTPLPPEAPCTVRCRYLLRDGEQQTADVACHGYWQRGVVGRVLTKRWVTPTSQALEFIAGERPIIVGNKHIPRHRVLLYELGVVSRESEA